MDFAGGGVTVAHMPTLNPIRALRDFSRKRQLARWMYQALATGARPGGIDVTRLDEEGVAALMLLLQKHQDITVVKSRSSLTLMLKADAERIFGAVYGTLRGDVLASPTDDLFHEEHRYGRRDAGGDDGAEGPSAA
jgi:hypothetical protein